MKSLLLALDGSPAAEVAIRLGLGLAERNGFRVTGLAVVDEPGIRHAEAVPPGATAFKLQREEADVRRSHERISGFLEDFGASCRRSKLEYEAVERTGDPHVEIAFEARCHDLVLINRSTHFKFQARDQVGDTFRRVSREAPRPIIATPDTFEGGKDVLVAYDNSSSAARTLQIFQLLGLYQNERIHLISIDENKSEAQARAAIGAKFLERHGREAHVVPIDSPSDPAEILLAETETLNPRLLVMGAYGRRGLKELFLGSTTEHLLFKKQCPSPIFMYH